jgi:hypothetical protein
LFCTAGASPRHTVVGLLCEKTLSVLFGKIAAKRTKNGVWRVSRLRARRGLRALDLRRLLKKAGENFHEKGCPKGVDFPLKSLTFFVIYDIMNYLFVLRKKV